MRRFERLCKFARALTTVAFLCVFELVLRFEFVMNGKTFLTVCEFMEFAISEIFEKFRFY